MGRGRARAVSVGVLGALSLAVVGCGAESHPNFQRPQVPTRVAVTITSKAVTVHPGTIGVGPERTQQLPQNQNDPQPPIKSDKGPLTVVFTAANQTRTDATLELRGPRDDSSDQISALSAGALQAQLPAGTYTVSAAGVPGARPGKLVVGEFRASSQNDVLLP
jgi:hypothetical protein